MKTSLIKACGIGLAAAVTAGGMTAHADNRELLDTMVRKGYLTQQEAQDIAKADTAVVRPANRSVERLTISGRLHAQYDWIDTDDKTAGVADPATRSNFELRRIRVGFKADLVNGWSAFVNTQFSNNAASLSDAIISKKFEDMGTFTVGYQKVTFGFEENTSSANIKAIERSVATNYWAGGFQDRGRLGFGARHIGLFWKGEVPNVDGFGYGLEVTNSQQGGGTSGLGVNNTPGVYGNLSYRGSANDLNYRVGVNLGYQDELANNNGQTSGSTFGWNPYAEINYGGMRLMGEFLGGRISDGRGAGPTLSRANPIGFNIIPSYKFTDELEAVFRYSYLDTNGRGVTPGAVTRGANNPAGNPSFDKTNAYYFGGNWYIVGNTVKLSAGYELSHFTNRIGGGANTNVHAVRTRLQLLF